MMQLVNIDWVVPNWTVYYQGNRGNAMNTIYQLHVEKGPRPTKTKDSRNVG